jgi:hypothetical protein
MLFYEQVMFPAAWVLGLYVLCKYKSCPITGLDRLLGLQEFVAPWFSWQSAHEGGKFISPMHVAAFTPTGDSPGALFCQQLSRPQRHSATGRIK